MTEKYRPEEETADANPRVHDPLTVRPISVATANRTSRKAIAPPLARHHLRALRERGISDEIIQGRGYESLLRSSTDNRPRDRLKRMGFAAGAYKDDRRFPGMLIPIHGAKGCRVSAQYRPDNPRSENGRQRKYEALLGRPAVLDVHPTNLTKLSDPQCSLWITEGVMKGDALATAGVCAVSLMGVFNWRNSLGTLGDWEDVPLRGREVLICFDSDAATNRNVARAMKRLGQWLRSKGVRSVRYIVTPEIADLGGKTGVDDYLAAGGSIAGLLDAGKSQAPDPDAGDDSLSDSRLAERVADDVLAEQFRHVRGLGWLEYEDTVWRDIGEERVIEEVRRYFRAMIVAAAAGPPGASSRLSALAGIQSAARITAVTRLTKGMDGVTARAEDFDAEPLLLNAANGVVDLRTGELLPHDPALLMRRSTGVAYRTGAKHEDWEAARRALPDSETANWVCQYLGSGATGLTVREDVATFWHGTGSNGKSTLLGACQAALGTYARTLLPTILGSGRDEHPTEYMELLSTRLAVLEETGEDHELDTTKLKRIVGTEEITARKMRQDPVTFRASHTLVITTNHRPHVRDTDHGTWRRLRMVEFPYRFGGSGHKVDLGLRPRLINEAPQQEAVLAWLVDGARAWCEADFRLPPTPISVELATTAWREKNDLVYAYASERLVSVPGHLVEVTRLRQDFNDWLSADFLPWSLQLFAERFEQHESLRTLGAERTLHPKSRRAVFRNISLRLS